MSRRDRFKGTANNAKEQPDRNSQEVILHAGEFFQLKAKQTRNAVEEAKLASAICYLDWAVGALKEKMVDFSDAAVAELGKYTSYLTNAERETARLREEVRVAREQVASQEAQLVAQRAQVQQSNVQASVQLHQFKLSSLEATEAEVRNAFQSSELTARTGLIRFFKSGKSIVQTATQLRGTVQTHRSAAEKALLDAENAQARLLALQERSEHAEAQLVVSQGKVAEIERQLAASKAEIRNKRKMINALESARDEAQREAAETSAALARVEESRKVAARKVTQLVEEQKQGRVVTGDLAEQLRRAEEERQKAAEQVEALTAVRAQQQLAAEEMAKKIFTAEGACRQAADEAAMYQAEVEKISQIAQEKAAALEEARFALATGFEVVEPESESESKSEDRFDSMPAAANLAREADECDWPEEEENQLAAAPRYPGM